MRRIALALLTCLPFVTVPFVHAAPADPAAGFPRPALTLPDRKPFQGLQLGPGNTFSVSKTPPDFELITVGLAPDGRFVALGWDSGRLEVYDLASRRKVAEFPGAKTPLELAFSARGDRLFVAASGRKMTIFELPSGKARTKWTAPAGRTKYDVQDLVVDPEGHWLAYATNDLSKVVSLDSEKPAPIADLGNAASLSLSPDGRQLFGVNRTTLTRYATSGWQVTGSVPLLAPAFDTSPVMVRAGTTGEGAVAAAVPSTKGLAIYGGEELSGRFLTQKPSARVAFLRTRGTFVDDTAPMTFLAPDGTIVCQRARPDSHAITIDAGGTWMALKHVGNVDLYRLQDVLADCPAPQP